MLSRQGGISGVPRETLFPPQANLLEIGFPRSAQHWLIRAPTGSGKTRIAEEALLNATQEGRIGVYIAPLHAILEERAMDWATRFADLRPLLLSANQRPSQTNPKPGQLLLLSTAEKFNSLILRWKSHHPWIARVGCLVIDELHTLGDKHRGATVEATIGRFQRLNPFAQIVGLTGTLANVGEMAVWLQARDFTTEWRPVPLECFVRHFKRPTEKHDILIAELAPVLAAGARGLVFVNSRKRSESLAAALRAQGIQARHLHAGVEPTERSRVCADFTTGVLQIVVATSSLEMGVNLPARVVVIFDAYCFDGDEFGPMPIQRYIQMSGRAGRPGLDPSGQSILLMPSWSADGDAYLTGRLPPVRSSLFSEKRLLHEVLLEVASRLSISRRHLETNFAARTLWRAQGGNPSTEGILQILLQMDLLKSSLNKQGAEFLSETPLGRIALQMLAPAATVVAWRDFYNVDSQWHPFDLLLRACLMEEVTPRPGFNFEEIDFMGDLLMTVPSTMLDQPPRNLIVTAGGEKRLLSSVKVAVMMFRRTQGATFEAMAKEFDTYSPDLRMLAENVVWTLETAQRIFAYLAHREWLAQSQEDDETPKRTRTPLEAVCADLQAMVRKGVPRDTLVLVSIPGIGPKRAMTLCANGICSLETLLSSDPAALGALIRLKRSSVEKLLKATAEVLKVKSVEDPFSIEATNSEAQSQPTYSSQPPVWPFGVDPYRVRRALELTVDHCSAELVRLSGGLEPHIVRIIHDACGHRAYVCDCLDFGKGTRQCKHVIRARLERNDAPDLLAVLRSLQPDPHRALRYSLGELWMKVGGVYDAFRGSDVDYEGRKFLSRALSPTKLR
jgi:helicase